MTARLPLADCGPDPARLKHRARSTGRGDRMAADGLMAVFMANRAQLVRFLRARGAADDAEDIAQDLWVKLSAGGQGPVSDPLGYLYRMADNLMIDRHRSAGRRRRREESWSGDDDANGASSQPSVERSLLSRERLGTVERALDALGERTSAIFRRFRVEGVGQKQIASEQGISLSAVEKHLRKAYRTLTDLQQEDDGESAPRSRLEIGGTTDAGG